MAKARVSDNKKTGRPATGEGVLVGVRIHPDDLARLDEWIEENAPGTSRPEVIRGFTLRGIKRKR